MKLYSAISVLALAAAPAFASAATSGFLIDFEKSWAYGETVDSTYASSGVTFTNVLGLSNGDGLGALPNGDYYANAPTPLGTASAQLDGVVNTTSFMNVADGVNGALSFFYSSPVALTGAIKAYSGLNGTGTLLGTFDLVANTSAYDVWTPVTFNFVGTAQSFDLTGTANVAGLDNISAVPEPETAPLALIGLALPLAMAAIRRRRA